MIEYYEKLVVEANRFVKMLKIQYQDRLVVGTVGTINSYSGRRHGKRVEVFIAKRDRFS